MLKGPCKFFLRIKERLMPVTKKMLFLFFPFIERSWPSLILVMNSPVWTKKEKLQIQYRYSDVQWWHFNNALSTLVPSLWNVGRCTEFKVYWSRRRKCTFNAVELSPKSQMDGWSQRIVGGIGATYGAWFELPSIKSDNKDFKEDFKNQTMAFNNRFDESIKESNRQFEVYRRFDQSVRDSSRQFDRSLPEDLSNHCLLAKACLDAVRYSIVTWAPSLWPGPGWNDWRLAKERSSWYQDERSTFPKYQHQRQKELSSRRQGSMATGKCGFGFRRLKKVWRAYAIRAKGHRLE